MFRTRGKFEGHLEKIMSYNLKFGSEKLFLKDNFNCSFCEICTFFFKDVREDFRNAIPKFNPHKSWYGLFQNRPG